MKKDLYKEYGTYSVNIQGNTTSVQIQQKTINSSQLQNVNQEFDFDKVEEVLNEISKYIPMFADTYGQDCKRAENALNEARRCISDRKNPSTIKKALSILKDISLKVSSSLIATGILELLTQIGI